jgi:hypothetical protein
MHMAKAVEEKVVRFAIDADLWKRFRLEALRSDRTASEYLAQLIEKEVQRARRVESRHNARAHRAGD